MYYSSANDPYQTTASIPAGVGPGRGYAAHQQPQQLHQSYEHDATYSIADYYANEGNSNWDTKSYQSDYSQAYLNPQHDMSNVDVHNPPPVPPLPYQAYPPGQQPYDGYAQRPVFNRDASTGYSTVREKLMRRRVGEPPLLDILLHAHKHSLSV